MSDIQEQSYKLKSIIYQQLIYTKIKYTCIVKCYFLNESFAYVGLKTPTLKYYSLSLRAASRSSVWFQNLRYMYDLDFANFKTAKHDLK